jgi:hypothetical protein
MFENRQIEAAPAYYAAMGGTTIPFIVSLLLQDNQGKPRLTPAVEKTLDRTVTITGREGAVIAIIADDDPLERLVPGYLERTMKIDGAILLLLCQYPETAERLMQFLHCHYGLSLVREKAC